MKGLTFVQPMTMTRVPIIAYEALLLLLLHAHQLMFMQGTKGLGQQKPDGNNDFFLWADRMIEYALLFCFLFHFPN